MGHSLKHRWQAFTRGIPGRRFQGRYAAAWKSRGDIRWSQRGQRVLLLLLALLSIAVAVVLMFIPGPAIPFYFLAGALLASESLVLARLMDWIELRLRVLLKRSRSFWRRSPLWARGLILAGFTGLSVVTTYVSYRLVIH